MEDDGSWIGRTLVTLVVLALLVAGAIWLVQNLGDDDGGGIDTPNIENNETNIDNDTTNNDGGTGGESTQPTSTSAP